MARYVDGYVLPVREARLDGYREMAAEAGAVWMDHEALQYVECVGDDLDPDLEGASFARFPDAIGAAPDETVVFSFIVFRSRAHRDEVNAAVMAELDDPDRRDDPMPFDVERMGYGGFEAIVDL